MAAEPVNRLRWIIIFFFFHVKPFPSDHSAEQDFSETDRKMKTLRLNCKLTSKICKEIIQILQLIPSLVWHKGIGQPLPTFLQRHTNNATSPFHRVTLANEKMLFKKLSHFLKSAVFFEWLQLKTCCVVAPVLNLFSPSSFQLYCVNI